MTGVEPATSSLGSWHSTTELHPLSAADSMSRATPPGQPPSRRRAEPLNGLEWLSAVRGVLLHRGLHERATRRPTWDEYFMTITREVAETVDLSAREGGRRHRPRAQHPGHRLQRRSRGDAALSRRGLPGLRVAHPGGDVGAELLSHDPRRDQRDRSSRTQREPRSRRPTSTLPTRPASTASRRSVNTGIRRVFYEKAVQDTTRSKSCGEYGGRRTGARSSHPTRRRMTDRVMTLARRFPGRAVRLSSAPVWERRGVRDVERGACATILPALVPPSGPRSMTWSACAMKSVWCSTTSTEWPRATSPSRTPISVWMSCR